MSNNVSATMCPRLPGPLVDGVTSSFQSKKSPLKFAPVLCLDIKRVFRPTQDFTLKGLSKSYIFPDHYLLCDLIDFFTGIKKDHHKG